jgi:uncharacterized membrane protein YhhN
MARGSRNSRYVPLGLTAYSLVAAADVALAITGKRRLRWITKPALMPLLVATESPSADPLIVAGLCLSWLGDVALLAEGEGPFAAGLVSFLAAHLSYIAALTKRRAGGIRKAPGLAIVYTIAWLGLNRLLWPRSGRLQWPVLIYGTGLVAMALAALDTGDLQATTGGAAFLASDSMLALDAFGVARLPAVDGLVMLTYAAAQPLIAHGARRK